MTPTIEDFRKQADELGKLLSAHCYTRQELAEHLGISVALLASWSHRGTGPRFFRLDHPFYSSTFYLREDVEDWVQNRWNRKRGRKAHEE